MASLDDILSSVKNISTGLSNVASAWRRGQGNLTSAPITTATQVATGSGRVVSVCVVAIGSADGAIYNAASLSAAGDANVLAAVPVGTDPVVLTLGLEFTAGLVVTPGTDQVLVVTYYQG